MKQGALVALSFAYLLRDERLPNALVALSALLIAFGFAFDLFERLVLWDKLAGRRGAPAVPSSARGAARPAPARPPPTLPSVHQPPDDPAAAHAEGADDFDGERPSLFGLDYLLAHVLGLGVHVPMVRGLSIQR